MSIASMGGMVFGSALFLSQTEAAQSTDSATDGSSCADASSSATASTTPDEQPNNLSGNSKGALSSELLALLLQLQSLSGTAAAQTTSSSNASSTATSAVSGTSAASSSSTSANPIASLFSSMDANSDGTVSQSEFESYIENLGGTQNQADTLYSQLDQGSSTGLTEQQLAQDASQYGPPGPPPPPPQQMSAGQMADSLVSAMGGSDGSVTKSEFENFVTSNGGTTSEADTDFSALDTSGSTTLSASDLQQAIENQQAQASSSTSSPLLSWLDQLSATTSGSPTA